MHEAADDLADDEDGLADEENIEEGRGSPKPAGAGEKQAVSGDKEDEQVDLVFPAFNAVFSPVVKSLTVGEENSIDSVANTGSLKEKSMAFSQILKLGFSKTEEARGNSTTNLTGFPSGEGSFGVVRVDTSMPKEKGCILTSDNEVTSVPPYLGFSARNLDEEDEASNGVTMAAILHRGSEDDNIKRRPNLGFGGAPPTGNNGGRASSPFNFYEFLLLAHSVLDAGDEKSMKALEELKIKWNERFGRAAVNRCFPPPVAQPKEPELVRGLGKAIRCLVPPSKTEKTTGILGENSRSDAEKMRTPDSDGLPKVGADMDSHVAGEVARPLSTDDVSPRSSADVSPSSADVSPKSAADVSPKSAHDIMPASSTDVSHGIRDDLAHIRSISPPPPSTPTGLFVGNVPLHTCPNLTVEDKITHAFNNSTRKTLSYVAPTIQNGEVVVRPTLDTIRNGSTRWRTTAVGYFLGKRPYYHHVKEFALSVWPGLREVTATIHGFFFFQFKTVAHMEEIIEGGPWLFQGQPIVLQKWVPGMVMRKPKHTQVPVWIKLRHLPVELWTEEGLSIVASGIGKPLYPDAITRACTRLDFARVCVMLDVHSKLHKHIIIMAPDEEGGETPCKVDVEYECTCCMTLGHAAKDCAINKAPKPVKPSVSVHVPIKGPSQPPPVPDWDIPRPAREVETQREGREVTVGPSSEDRGKAIIIYNAFDALHQLEDTEELIRGPKQSSPIPDHQLAVKDIVAEFRLQFLGLLETRVRTNNVSHIQAFLLPQWKWFVDYGLTGNRVWIAWDDNFIDVDVIECGTQFIHYHVNFRALQESIAIIVIYGANEVVERRELWDSLETIAMQCIDIPWLVGGDFSAVRDLSEICGASGDIRMAMEEFNICIQNAGLLPLPMQGEWYTWHNCSANPRNLWKRLDRMLINDTWMDRFSTSFYTSLTPRTSDHSPMVLYRDSRQHYGGMFRFDNYLALSPEFIPSVQQVWQHNIIGVPMYAVTRKLKALKPLAKGFLETAQLLVTLNRRDELFLQLEHYCRLVLAKAAKLEQIMLQQRAKMKWMKGGDQCSRVFFRKIAQRRSARRILQINDEHGDTHTEPGAVVNEFVTFYHRLLGGERRRAVIDLRFLRPWARHLLSEEDASSLLVPFTLADVKQAVFDIDEDKAPGPDGYSSGFFKAAWPIVGHEVSSVVLDFFNTGRLLKQINTTLLALIPKARLPPRCALKVDIRKAYDTVEWDFMIAVMELFGFPSPFVKWIEVCVTTPSFSVGLNGKPHGFFKGARGLRQGDPLSPYLFVLVMEVLHLGFLQLIDQDELFSFHWKCDTARVFQLGFADDLLLFCKADMNSIGILKTGLDRFAEWSGLRLNVQKSYLIISRSAQGLREEMLATLGFQEGVLPMRYLGLPLLSSRLTIADSHPLLLKIDKRIAGWEGMAISYAGRVQIIKSILMSLSLYWASAFILPKKVTNVIEKRLRTFLWKGTTTTGYAKVAWKDLCRPTDEGGLGFKDIPILNRALMMKKLCDIIMCDRTSIWVEWLYQGRLRDTSIWTIQEHGGSWSWRKILRLRVFLRPMVDYQIRDGRRFYLWQDPWHYLGPLIHTFPRGPRLLGIEESAKLSTVISGGEWQWPLITDFECLEITHSLPMIHGGEDRIIWRFEQGYLTSQALYRLIDPPGPKVGWSSLLFFWVNVNFINKE
ncbi:UNVERIFIED_CONTAM: hypothetical protein Sindi_3021300 [Sesamum indicum]